MQATRSWIVAVLVGMVATGSCVRDEHDGDAGAKDAAEGPVKAVPRLPVPPIPAAPMSAADSTRARVRIAVLGDSVRAAFGEVDVLGAREIAELRQDRNAEQVATARSLGLRVSGDAEIGELRRQGRLVTLEDSTAYWVLRDMEHSVPYVTPDTHAMLERVGRRFHARLDRLGLPRYRMKVTSALRTDETQAELRKTNSYASRTVSAHEFGTTVDVSHERFAVPADPRRGAGPAGTGMREMEVEMLDRIGVEHAKALQAELGRAIAETREEGGLHVMMENRQPVYHMTVARRFPSAD